MGKKITKLAWIMFKKQISMNELSKKTGISRQGLNEIHKGRVINVKTGNKIKIAKALNCKVSDFWEVK